MARVRVGSAARSAAAAPGCTLLLLTPPCWCVAADQLLSQGQPAVMSSQFGGGANTAAAVGTDGVIVSADGSGYPTVHTNNQYQPVRLAW